MPQTRWLKTQQKFISQSSGSWKSKIRKPTWPDEGPLLGHRLLVSSCRISYKDMHACMHVQPLSCVGPFATPWTAVHQAPLSMGFFRQEYWSGLPFLLPENLLDPGIKPVSPALAGRFLTTELPVYPQKSQLYPDVTWTYNLLIWSKRHYHCAKGTNPY